MKKSKRTLLWRIEHPDFVAPSYLFGTMHVRDKRAFRFNDLVKEKIEECTAFATEFNLDEAEQGMPSSFVQLPDNKQLSDYLPPKKYKKLAKVLEKQTGIDINPFQRMRPMILLQMITAFLLAKEEQHALDEYLFRYAKKEGKELLGLETYQDQLRIMQALPLETQFKSLIEIATNFKSFRRQVLKTAAAYESADIQKIFKAARKGAQGMRKILLYDRNIVMADRFMEIAKEQSLLAAIGAGHLGGKKGVLRLLKLNGCTIGVGT